MKRKITLSLAAAVPAMADTASVAAAMERAIFRFTIGPLRMVMALALL